MQDLHYDLAWLEMPPPDWRENLRAAKAHPLPGPLFRQLARYRLTGSQLSLLGAALRDAQGCGKPLDPLQPLRLGIAGSGTIDMIVPQLIASAARHGIALECVVTPYGQAYQQAIDATSALRSAGCDLVLIAMLWHDVPGLTGSLAENDDVDASLAFLSQIADGMRQSGAGVIFQTLVPPSASQFGSLDRALTGTRRRRLDAINAALSRLATDPADHVFDVAALAERIGLDRWIMRRDWNVAKLPFAAGCIPAYAEHLARFLAATRGLSRRCLVLDLDNTLWGGILGDDGLEGLALGEGDPVGEAHLALQRYALDLHQRGILLAVSSKNDPDFARTAVETHPEMLLRARHFAAFQANWSDKAANLRAIADEVSLGLSSLVFLDDNPAERALIRRLLPEVAVPELPQDPSYYVDVLDAAGYFEAVSYSAEDAARTEFFQQNKARKALLSQSGGLDSYLASLDMTAQFGAFDETGLERIAQLVGKSNQFNLTTRRYTPSQLREIMADPDHATVQVRLRDCFGDNGMVSVVILKQTSASCVEIDTWLMSCRVLGRRLEEAVLRQLLSIARARGAKTLIGRYLPTDRNAIVRDHYAKLGFSLVETMPDGGSVWSLETSADPSSPPIAIGAEC